ncbi:MAG: hypothetical protein L0L18_07980, partial [Acidipropionibacterium jensenii]|nr:hypothetical protein [Acidipropionibacterium jensenii]
LPRLIAGVRVSTTRGSGPTIVYKAVFSEMQAGGWSFKLPAIQFEAVPGGEVDLTLVAPAPNAPDGVVRGPAGTSISDVLVEGTDLVVMVTDESGTRELSRLPLDDVVRAEAQAAAQAVKDELAAELGDASESASKAKAEADRATEQATAAAGSADTAVLAQGDAAASADHAAERAEYSEKCAGTSRKYNDVAWTARTDSISARDASVAAKDDAVSAKDAAQASATDAQGAATTADQTVRDAVTEVTAVTDGHRQAAETAAGEAQSSATEGRGYRDDAREAAAQAEDIATGDLPSASESTRGLIQMTGDLAGSGDEPRVPALALAAPGASVQVVPLAPGWANAVADAAATPTGWGFDGEWLTPPPWLDRVTVTVDWCGGSSVVLRGRRPDGTAVTLATVPAGTPETHRSATVVVDLSQHEAVAVAATWTQEDLEAVCTASLVVQVLPSHEHTRADLPWWDEVMSGYVRGDDARLSDPRSPTKHEHEIGEVRGLDAALGVKLDASKIQVVAALPESPVEGTIYLVTGE